MLSNQAHALSVTEVHGRPFHVRVPVGWDGVTPIPVVIVLHGIAVTASYQNQYFQLGEQADARRFLLVYPEGTRNWLGLESWNGANCCELDTTRTVDDVGFIDDIITYMRGHFAVDSRRVFLIGHSNGAFLANRYACERSQVAAIVTISGAHYLDATVCGAPFPGIPALPGLGKVSVLHVHGTLDEIVGFVIPPPPLYPVAWQTIFSWRYRNGCISAPTSTMADLMPPTGSETEKQHFECVGVGGAGLDYWIINGGDHIPNIYRSPDVRAFTPQAIDWLFAHPRP